MTAMAIFFLILQVAGFVGGAVLGGRVYNKISADRKNPLFIGGGIILVLIGYMFITNGAIPNEWVRTAMITAVAFAGGLIVRARNDIMKNG